MIYDDPKLNRLYISFHVVRVFTPTQLVFLLETSPKTLQNLGSYISFDTAFYDDFEFLVKILISPTHFEKTTLKQIAWADPKNFSTIVIFIKFGVVRYATCICMTHT